MKSFNIPEFYCRPVISWRFLVVILLGLTSFAYAQPNCKYWSSIPCHVNSDDSSLVLSVTKNSWKNYFRVSDKKKPIVWESETYFHNSYNVISASSILSDSSRIIQRFDSWYELCLQWNRNADTFHVISFTPAKGNPRYFGSKSWHDYWFDQYRLSLHDYLNSEPIGVQTAFKNALFTSFSEQMNTATANSRWINNAIYRNVSFHYKEGSPEIFLPHATFFYLTQELQQAVISRKIPCYVDSFCTQLMVNPRDNNLWYIWDSTNQVEDINKPGTFIVAPIKGDAQPNVFQIFEAWTFANPSPFNAALTPQFTCASDVISYGITLETGLKYWFKKADFETYMRTINFNMTPYNEMFKAERFMSFHIEKDWILR